MIFKKQLILSLLALVNLLFFTACGKTSVEIDESTYEPKIVINGFLYPQKRPTRIFITRNFPVGTTIDKEKIALTDADVSITDLSDGSVHPLVFNRSIGYFEYPDTDWQIACGQSYRLRVTAPIDGQTLSAASTTTVPDRGLQIDRQQSIYGDLYYRQKDEQGRLISPRVAYRQSPKAAFYLLSISGLEASVENFIYENPVGQDIRKALEEGMHIEDFQYRAKWTRPENILNGLSVMEVNWYMIWFYGRYRLILYAGDRNFYHFYTTHRNVQEPDGNLHQPLFDIEGDGIGVFGSAVTDTVYLNILKKPSGFPESKPALRGTVSIH